MCFNVFIREYFRCSTPNGLPEIPSDAYSLVARLAISNSIDGPPLAYTNFTFYDCSRFKLCSTCVSSPFPCDWCIESNQCVAGSAAENRCRSQQLVNGVEVLLKFISLSVRSGCSLDFSTIGDFFVYAFLIPKIFLKFAFVCEQFFSREADHQVEKGRHTVLVLLLLKKISSSLPAKIAKFRLQWKMRESL